MLALGLYFELCTAWPQEEGPPCKILKIRRIMRPFSLRYAAHWVASRSESPLKCYLLSNSPSASPPLPPPSAGTLCFCCCWLTPVAAPAVLVLWVAVFFPAAPWRENKMVLWRFLPIILGPTGSHNMATACSFFFLCKLVYICVSFVRRVDSHISKKRYVKSIMKLKIKL